MAVTSVLRGSGKWDVTLNAETPKDLIDKFKYFGHVTIHPTRVDPRVFGDTLLQDARYTGVYRGRSDKTDGTTKLSGAGMAIWLGDEDGKGRVQETLLNLDGPFHTVLPTVLPPSVSIGTIFNIGKTFTGNFQFVNARQMVDYITQTLGAAWRVNNDGTIDAGNESDLFVIDPKVIIARNKAGRDLLRRALSGNMDTDQDVEDFTTRVVLIASDAEGSSSTGSADILPGLNIYKDLFGNSVEFTRLVSESGTDEGNAEARAQLQLNRFTGTRDSITLSSDEFDIPGDIDVGDYLWVWDPDKQIRDVNNEVYAPWGAYINPMKLQLTEQSWPIADGMGVCYRDPDGLWYDLSSYVVYESGETSITVGGYSRSLVSGDGGVAASPSPPDNNTTIPGVPEWVTPFLQSVYQSGVGDTKAQVQLKWLQPDNTDGSDILDGGFYEIRYRQSTVPLFPTTHLQMGLYSYNELGVDGTFAQPIVYPGGDWQYATVPWDALQTTLYELTPSLPYEAQIRAVDIGSSSTPPNVGDWSASTFFQTARDTLPPAVPAAPEIGASTISVQMVHRLGRADGGEYNLDMDLQYIELHGWTDPLFQPDEQSRLGKVAAGAGMIIGEIPAVATFPIKETVPLYYKVVAVDIAGNRSLPSIAVEATVDLIDSSHISELTVSKLTAGEMTADVLMAGVIRTAKSGARVETSYLGIQVFNQKNVKTVDIDASDGSVQINLQDPKDGLQVNDSNGVQRFHVATTDVTIRDGSGNEVFSNESSQKWGITQPNLQTSFYPRNSDTALQNNTADGAYYVKLVAGHIINHPVVKFGVRAVHSNGDSTAGRFAVEWWPFDAGYPGSGPSPAGYTLMAEGPTQTTAHFSYTWPSNMFGQLVYIAYLTRLNSGQAADRWTHALPIYFYGTGV